MKRVLLRYLGTEPYRGYDRELERHIELRPGESITTSETKHRELADRYPGQWQDLGPGALAADPVTATNVVLVTSTPPARRRRSR
jgi:hypothetical protein